MTVFEKGFDMWYIILGAYLLISAFVGALFWISMIVAKRSDERTMLDAEDENDQ